MFNLQTVKEKKYNVKSNQGFTLIELLIVVSIIAVLSGVVIGVLNISRTRKLAEDGVRRANMDKLVQGLESYYAAEGKAPVDSNADGNPINDGTASTLDDTVVKVYIKSWPGLTTSGASEASSEYFYFTTASPAGFGVVVRLQATNTCLKYVSTWDPATIKECGSKPDVVTCDANANCF